MLRRTLAAWSFAGLLAAIALTREGWSQESKKTEKTSSVEEKAGTEGHPADGRSTTRAAVPGEVDVLFLNGSTVRMVVQPETLEVATPYGKLAVPLRQVRAIDFGVHFPEGVAARLGQAVRNLSSESYRERERAAAALVELGPLAYPALLEASKASDMETARRARDLVKKLQGAHAKKDLKPAVEDRIVTPTFTIVGRIVTPTIRARAEYFGEVELRLASLRTLRAVSGPGEELEVQVDAARYANAGQWLDTKFAVDGRSALVIGAKGTVDTWPQQPGQYLVGPGGMQGLRAALGGNVVIGRRLGQGINNQTHGGALLGKIGEDGEPFLLGEHYEGTPEAEGNLYLHIVPSPWGCPSAGHYDVKVARKS